MIATTTCRRFGLMRCAEVMTGIIMDPSTQDPWGALIYANIMNARRLMRKSAQRVNDFIRRAAAMRQKADEPWTLAPGPVSGVLESLGELGVQVTLDVQNAKIFLSSTIAPTVDLLHQSSQAVAEVLKQLIRRAMLQQLEREVNKEEGRRKDMRGIPPTINRRATLATMRRKKSSVPGLSIQLHRRLLVTIVSGSLRARDRLKAAKLVDDDVCQDDGDRHTTHHILWKCVRFADTRRKYIEKLGKITAVANSGSKATAKYINEIMANNCFQHTGIIPADEEALAWAAARSADSSFREEHAQGKLRWTSNSIAVNFGAPTATLGSANLVQSELLGYGGWGI
jgi:hypothetical protein